MATNVSTAALNAQLQSAMGMLSQLTGGAGGAASPAAGAAGAGTASAANAQAYNDAFNRASNLDYRVRLPIESGLGRSTIDQAIKSLAEQFNASQSKISDLTQMFALETKATGQVNQAHLVQIQTLTSASNAINELNKSIFDKRQRAVDSWLRPG